MEEVPELVEWVGGTNAAVQSAQLFTQGFPKDMQPLVKLMARTDQSNAGPCHSSVLGTRLLEAVLAAREWIRAWAKFGGDAPELQAVAQCLLSSHATSASERNWSLWGRMYTPRQGLEWAWNVQRA
jgi:hypothetical protein